jgi:hypothetical protein
MGGFPSSSSQSPRYTTSKSSRHYEQYLPEILRMRQIIKEKSYFPFVEKMVFVIYYPPDFPASITSKYISDRVKLPIFPVEEMKSITDEIQTNERYANGFILTNFSPGFQDLGVFKLQMESLGMKFYLLFFEIDGAVSLDDLINLEIYPHPSHGLFRP